MKALLFMVGLPLLFAANAYADTWPDDHGDAPAAATSASVQGTNTTAVGGIVEIDIDEDWFQFTAWPGQIYEVKATASGLWDTLLEVRAPDGIRVWSATNSAPTPAPAVATVVWTNRGAAGPCYVGIRGYLTFTTGAYSLAVRSLNGTDSDADGLPDVWELQHFGTLTNAAAGDVDEDGFSNGQELLAFTAPTNKNSALQLESIQPTNGATRILWQAAPYGTYRLSATTNLLLGTWSNLATRYRDAPAAGQEMMQDTNGAPVQAYRVQLLMDGG
jgi:hypothetical protein